MSKYKKDIIAVGIMILLGLIVLLVVMLTQKKGEMVTVDVSGQRIVAFPLEEEREYVIQGANGGTNTLIIKDGYAWLKDASCPDGLCIHMGKIHNSSQSIICLPNEVVVGIDSDVTTDIDIIVQ